MDKREKAWIITFWIAIITLFIWLLAKQFGVINTPIIIQAIPYISGLIALLALAKSLGSHVHKLEVVVTDTKDIKTELKEIRKEFHNLDTRTSIIEHKIA